MEFDVLVNGVPLVFVVLGLVEWFKRFGISDKPLIGVSMAVGLTVGGAYQYSVAPPADFAGWFGLAIYGLALGLTASGIYDALKNATRPAE